MDRTERWHWGSLAEVLAQKAVKAAEDLCAHPTNPVMTIETQFVPTRIGGGSVSGYEIHGRQRDSDYRPRVRVTMRMAPRRNSSE